MSFAFILYCLWIAAAAAIPLAPARKRPELRFAVMVAGAVPVLLALVTVGFIPAVLALTGVIALFPAPMRDFGRFLWSMARPYLQALRQRIHELRGHRPA